MALTPEMEAALDGAGFVEFAALKIVFADKTVRLLDGAGRVDLGSGEVFTGDDEDYGVWVSGEDITDGVDSEAPRFRFALKVPDAETAQSLLLASRQLSEVTVITGLVDPLTGLALPGWEEEFVGFFDTASRRAGVGEDIVDCDSFSIFEMFFENAEGVRLSGAWLKQRYPDALGLDHVSDIERTLPWGVGGAGTAFSGKNASDFDWKMLFTAPSLQFNRARVNGTSGDWFE